MRKLIMILMPIMMLLVIGYSYVYNMEPSIEGTYLGNISDFSYESNIPEEIDPVVSAYMETVNYKILNLDKEKMTAEVELYVPQIKNELNRLIEYGAKNYSAQDSDQIKKIIKDEFLIYLNSELLVYEANVVEVPLVRDVCSLKLDPDEKWYELIMGQYEDLYLEYYSLMIGALTSEKPKR